MRRALASAFTVLAIVATAAPAVAVEEMFARPPGIHARVRLWTRVYSEVDTNGGLIHDSEDLDVVYEVIRWPKTLTPSEQEARIAHTKQHYQGILQDLASGRAPLSAEERRVLALFPPGVSRATLSGAVDRVRFQRGLADRFRDGLVRAGQWEPHIQQVFRDNALPAELASLPHVESSFNPVAYSKAGAAGLWQFMPGTGRRFLRIDRAVDERYDPWRSSEAAAALLRENYRTTGTWPLAITAYNHGAAGMLRAVQQVGTTDISVIIDRYQSESFGFASQNFYTEFLAAYDVERSAARHFGDLSRERPAPNEIVVTRHPTSAMSLARAFGVDIGVLRELNLGLRDSVWNGRIAVPTGYALRLPKVAGRPPAEQVIASVPRSDVDEGTGRKHRVRRGETLAQVAKKYGIAASDLAKVNGLRTKSRLHAGQTLRIPGTAEESEVATVRVAAIDPAPAKAGSQAGAQPTKADKAPSAKAAKAKAQARSHTVKKGETLNTIARRTGIPVARLAQANGIPKPYTIKPGQKIRVPAAGSPDG